MAGAGLRSVAGRWAWLQRGARSLPFRDGNVLWHDCMMSTSCLWHHSTVLQDRPTGGNGLRSTGDPAALFCTSARKSTVISKYKAQLPEKGQNHTELVLYKGGNKHLEKRVPVTITQGPSAVSRWRCKILRLLKCKYYNRHLIEAVIQYVSGARQNVVQHRRELL